MTRSRTDLRAVACHPAGLASWPTSPGWSRPGGLKPFRSAGFPLTVATWGFGDRGGLGLVGTLGTRRGVCYRDFRGGSIGLGTVRGGPHPLRRRTGEARLTRRCSGPACGGPLISGVMCLMRRLSILLALAIIGCDGGSSPDAGRPPSGGGREYLTARHEQVSVSHGGWRPAPAATGGAAGSWAGASSTTDVMNPMRTTAEHARRPRDSDGDIPVGSDLRAMVLADPSMTTWASP